MPPNNYSFANTDGSELTDRTRVVSEIRSTLTMKRVKHEGKITRLDRAAGITVTLPNATGSGDVYRFTIGTALTSNNYKVQVARSADFMRGQAWLICSANAGFATANTGTLATESDTLTLNGTTTGGVIGDEFVFTDIAKNVWAVQADLGGSSTAATPFSAAV